MIPVVPDGLALTLSLLVLAVALAAAVARPRVLPEWAAGPSASPRTMVMVAVGILAGAGALHTTEALELLRGDAVARTATADEVARRIVDRTLPAGDLTGRTG